MLTWVRGAASKLVLFAVLAFSLTAGAALLHYLPDTAHAAHAKAPDVALTRLDGTPLRLAFFTGKPVVVNLWATWCPPCRREMPMLRDAQMRNSDVVFVFVNQGEDASRIRAFLSGQQLALENVLLDPDHKLAAQLGTDALPTTLFVDRNGELVDRWMGMLSPETLAQQLDFVRDNREVAMSHAQQ